ncbi:cation transporting ATPase C-terminal domain-containing protein [Tumidithrix elongata RA019]|uniref:Cation transporting ATPase C-terminal domain-containing protein n=1 Tax=Tumidithrix elongata BACA0141 TaxID=2716417 RepID=A0AAW9PVR6_9CYAN|nr:cation transporting ATPase C-terminal domain-containing protein [Tumidithrix elongata RA019]
MSKPSFLPNSELPWHYWDRDQVLAQVQSSAEGLSYVAARQRLRQYGANKLPQKPRSLKTLWQPLINPFTYILLATAAFFGFGLRLVAEGIAIAVIGTIHGAIGLALTFWSLKTREVATLGRTQRRQSLPAASVLVQRDGEALDIPARDLVIGDLLILQTGDRPSVDIRLIEASEDLQTNQTSLGGEAIAPKQATESLALDTAVLERTNVIYAGTEITAGKGKGIAIATGHTAYWQSHLVVREQPFSALHTQLRTLRRVWVAIVGLVAIAIALLNWQRGADVATTAVVAVLLSTYPQNLLRLATQVQLIGMGTLAKKRLWVRFPSAIDALSRLNTIALILESDITLAIDNLSQAGIRWCGLIRASESDAQALGTVLGIEVFSYFDAPQERLRTWQGDRKGDLKAVAVVGKDIEDIALLRQADVGICDRTCKREIQDSSGLILPREDFRYIPVAILEGRAVFDRLQRFVLLLAASAFTLVLLALGDAVVGFGISPLQMLWVGAIATPLVAIPLLIETTAVELIQQPAYRFQTMLRRGNYLRLLLAVLTMTVAVNLVFWLKYQGDPALLVQARTMAFVTLVFSQALHACAIARHSLFQNIPLAIAVILIATLQVIFVQVVVMGEFMGTVPLSLIEWAIASLAATAVFWLQELVKGH